MRRAENTPITFVDLLDPERILVLAPNKKDAPDVVTARVFWAGAGKDGKTSRIFGGITTIPRNLLYVGDTGSRDRRPPPRYYDRRDNGGAEQVERIGFMSEGTYTRKLEREAQAARRTRRENFEE